MKHVQKLSNTEMELMEMIWHYEQSVTSSELLHTFALKRKELKSQTIHPFLSSLVEKGTLIVTRKGRINSYIPCISPVDYKLWETQDILTGYIRVRLKI